ncbi:MAG TPA: hypothetical protein VFM93_10285 [Candidatus Limnocylindria bacterium]|nr:hypothetical protein [Candidatus Limnocylindria bacterium]
MPAAKNAIRLPDPRRIRASRLRKILRHPVVAAQPRGRLRA